MAIFNVEQAREWYIENSDVDPELSGHRLMFLLERIRKGAVQHTTKNMQRQEALPYIAAVVIALAVGIGACGYYLSNPGVCTASKLLTLNEDVSLLQRETKFLMKDFVLACEAEHEDVARYIEKEIAYNKKEHEKEIAEVSKQCKVDKTAAMIAASDCYGTNGFTYIQQALKMNR